jgi:protein-tyrosine phosphatase
MKILMVCLGNICRSPLAEGILQSKLQANKVQVDSAGTAAYHVGHLPDARSVEVAHKYGIDITKQRARKFLVEDFDVFDRIYAMDFNNYKHILAMARNVCDEQKVQLILNELQTASTTEVPDPYYVGGDAFETVYEMLDDACSIIASKIEKL